MCSYTITSRKGLGGLESSGGYLGGNSITFPYPIPMITNLIPKH